MLLLVAVDAAHPLLQPGRVPGQVPVQQPPGELHVQPLARRVGADHVLGAALSPRPAEELDLPLPLAEVHPAVNLGDRPGEAEPFEPPDEVDEGVAVLGEDEQLLVPGLGVVQDLPELVELRLVPPGVHLPGQVQERPDLVPLGLEFRQRDRHDAAQGLGLGDLVLLLAPLGGLLVGGLLLEHVLGVVQLPLQGRQFLGGDPARLDEFDPLVELLGPAFEGPQQGVGRTGQPPLEDGHRQPGRRAVEDAGAVVVGLDVGGRLVVEGLLADLPPGEVVAERVADPARVDAFALEVDHLLLGTPEEVAAAGVVRVGVEGVHRGQGVGLQQPPEGVVGEVLAHVGRGRQQQQVGAGPVQRPAGLAGRDAGQGLGDPIAVGLADGEVGLTVGPELVGLVEDGQVVGLDTRLLEPGEGPLAGQGIDADDHPVAAVARERVAGPGSPSR